MLTSNLFGKLKWEQKPLPNLFFNTDFKRVVSTHAKGSAQCAVLNSTTVKKNQAHTKKPKSLPDYPGICLPCGRSSLGWVWICSSVFCSHMNRTQPQSFHTTWPSWARHEPWYFLIWSRREELSFLLEIKSWVPTWLALWYLELDSHQVRGRDQREGGRIN